MRAGVLGGLGGVHLRVPAPQLPLDVAGAAHQVRQADLGRVERVQGDEHVDDLLPRRRPGLGREGEPGVGVGQDLAVDIPHHVELGAGDVGVGAVGERYGDRHRRRRHRGDEPPFAAHVVRGSQHAAGRRAAQRVDRAYGVGEPVREVRPAARDQPEVDRRDQAADVAGEPALDPGGFDTRQRRRATSGRGG